MLGLLGPGARIGAGCLQSRGQCTTVFGKYRETVRLLELGLLELGLLELGSAPALGRRLGSLTSWLLESQVNSCRT